MRHLLLILAVSWVSVKGSDFAVEVNKDGSYAVSLSGEKWFQSAPTYITVKGHTFSTQDGGLKLINISTSEKNDKLGPRTDTILKFKATCGTMFEGIISVYERYNMVMFGQNFPEGIPNSSMKVKNQLSTSFPSFSTEDFGQNLGFLSYGGYMWGDTQRTAGRWSEIAGNAMSGTDSGPLVLFPEKSRNATLVISPFNQFMIASADFSDGVAAWGLIGTLSYIPVDFTYSTVLFFGQDSITNTLLQWGDMMRFYYGKSRSYAESDMTANYLGYYTDNGAYYYYTTEKNKTYEETLIDVKKYADSEGIPYQYIQYDSWWYYQGPGQGVTKWIARPQIFPNGMKNLWSKLGLPVVAHNRWWSDKTVYAKQNNGSYDFIVETKNRKAIPVDQAFWDDLMRTSKQWGLSVYEQDWLNFEYDEMDITSSDPYVGRTWLLQMGAGAAKSGINIQYCMALSREALQSLEIPQVTQVRVTDDYQPGQDNWKIGVTSIFAWAMGVVPFKDNFWTTAKQPGNPYSAEEKHSALHAAVSSLSYGPVAPSDMIGASNRSLIMKSCTDDGLLLKPSRPAFAIDDQIRQSAFESQGVNGEVYTTFSDIAGMRFGVVLAADLKEEYKLSIFAANFGEQFPASYVYSMKNGITSNKWTQDTFLKLSNCTKTDFCLYYTTPALTFRGKPLAILGELSKWVPMSPQRVHDIQLDQDNVRIELRGSTGEKVDFMVYVNNVVQTFHCVISETQTARIDLRSKKCT